MSASKAAAFTFMLALGVAIFGPPAWGVYAGLALTAVAIMLASEPKFLFGRFTERVDARSATEDHKRG